MISRKRFVLFVLIFAFALAITGCGPSPEEIYFTNVSSAMNKYRADLDELGGELKSFTADSLNNEAWMEATFTALDSLNVDGQTLAATPSDQVPEKYADFNDILVQISEQTTVFVEDFKAALNSQDKAAILATMDKFKAVLALFQQSQDALNSNQ
jgi:hypothetical protein